MKKEFLQYVIVVCTSIVFLLVTDSYAQAGSGKGTINYKDGSVQKGEIYFKKTKLFITDQESQKKTKVDPATVASFEHHQSNYTKKYVFALTDFSAKHKRKYYIYSLIKDGKKAKIYAEVTAISQVSNALHYSKKVNLFIQKSGEPYAAWVHKHHTDLKERLRVVFSDCQDLVQKIDTESKKYLDVYAAVAYYNDTCGK